jgi:transposase
VKSSKRIRRTHSPEFKAKLIAECQRPGSSIAAIALAHQINDNLLRTWLRKSTEVNSSLSQSHPVEAPPRLVPVQLTTPMESPPFIRIHLQQGNTQIHLEWPLASMAQCSEWLQSFLR